MCLPFLCGDSEDPRSRPNHDTQQWPPATPPPRPPSDRGDDGYRHEPVVVASPPHRGENHGYGVRKNFGVADTAVNMNGGPGAASSNSDSDMPASVGSAVPQTPQRKEPRTVVPALTSEAPAKREPNLVEHTHLAAGARHHGPVAASQPKEGEADTMQRAPVLQVARRDEDDDAASRYSR